MNSGSGDDEMRGGPGEDNLCDGFDLAQPDSLVNGGSDADVGLVYYDASASVTFISVETCGHELYDPACTLSVPQGCISEAP